MKQRFPFLAALTVAATVFTSAPSAFADVFRGTLVHEETLRVAPSADSARVGDAGRGNELIIIQTSRDWIQVEAILRQPSHDEGATEEEDEGKTITGWVPAKAVIISTTQDGDRIIFGEAADSEDQASRRRGRRDAAQDAMRLYYRVYDLMPASPLAAEALYRCRRYPVADRAGRCNDAPFGAPARILYARADERRLDEAGNQEISLHQMG